MAKRGRKPKAAPPAVSPDTPELRPCPFCGSFIVEVTHVGTRDNPAPPFFVACEKCSAMGPATEIDGNQAEAATLWNTRTGDTTTVSLPPAGAGGPDVGA